MSVSGKIQETQNAEVLYVASNSLRLHPVQEKLIQFTSQLSRGNMLSSADEIQLLQNLCRTIGAKKTLDVGVFTGYSAMSIALALPADGCVCALDISDQNAKLGMPFWEEAGVAQKINLVVGPAAESLKSLIDRGEAGTFDFAFIDADKTGYETYYELCLQLLRPGGIIAVDNMLWDGLVYDPATNDESTVALRALAKKIHNDQRVHVSFLTVGDGTVLAFKK